MRERFGTPLYVYDEATLRAQAAAALAFPHAYGLTVRYAMKACPNAAFLKLFASLGLHFDASSGHEVERLRRAGIPMERISLSSQELPDNFADYVRQGLTINACSLNQLERIGIACPGLEVGLRFNPGQGSGHVNRTNTGGPASSFGIWHAWVPQVRDLLLSHGLRAVRIHTHVGSGSDPAVWQQTAQMSLDLVRQFPEVRVLNLGGGYKVARMPDEKGTDLQRIGAPVRALFEAFAAEDGRSLHLEIEPGTFLVAHAGVILTTVQDLVSTGPEGYEFLKTDTGMTEILRPSLYGALHPLHLLQEEPTGLEKPYVVVGHCCESGDLLTPARGQPEVLDPRPLPEARRGDLLVIGSTGAYCAGMPAKNYNSFPEAPEVLVRLDGSFSLIRQRQSLDQVLANEIPVEFSPRG